LFNDDRKKKGKHEMLQISVIISVFWSYKNYFDIIKIKYYEKTKTIVEPKEV
jgi:hypothetical protein